MGKYRPALALFCFANALEGLYHGFCQAGRSVVQTIKTGIVVALLLAVCYGAFVALNAPEPNIPDELLSEFNWDPDEAGLDNLMSVELPPVGDQLAGSSSSASAGGDPDNTGLGLDLHNALPALSEPTTSFPPIDFNTRNDLDSKPSSGPNVSLPSLPGNTSGTIAAVDGPAVSLSNSQAHNANSGSDNLLSLATSQDGAQQAGGQLVSQPLKPASAAVDSNIQVPLLDHGMAAAGSAPSNSSEPPTLAYSTAREQALQMASAGKLREALQLLSQYYASPELNHSQHADLVDILDALSREVIYSKRHLAEPAYVVKAIDTAASVADQYRITPELFCAINRLGVSKALVPGSQVKVLKGPFRAQVSLNRGELTVFMGELYAGRFPISIGKDPAPVEGSYEIVDRRRDRTYYGTGGTVIAANDPRNPYGGFWLNLGQDLCIHGTPSMASSDLKDAGCISLAPLDAADVYNIMAQGTQVTITR